MVSFNKEAQLLSFNIRMGMFGRACFICILNQLPMNSTFMFNGGQKCNNF